MNNCYKCGSPALKLCDGKKQDRTCDRPMCKACVSFSTPYIACIRGGKGRNTSQVLTLDYCEDCSKIKSNLKTMTESLTNYSTNSLTIYQAMAKILADIDFIGKDRKADMGNAGRYNFRGIDDIYNALHSSFAKYKVFIIPKILDSKLEIQEKEKTYNGSTTKSYTYSVILTVEFTFVSEDGSSISAIGIGHALDQSDKATNKAQSSALKYCLMQAFLIPTEESKDVEVENIQAAPTARKKPPDAQEKLEPLPSNDRENRLKELKVGILEMIEALEWSNDEQYKWANKLHGKPSSEWTLQQWSQASVDLQDHIDKAGAAQNLVEAGADY